MKYKSIIAMLLLICIGPVNAFSQDEAKQESFFKDRFISSGGLFFAQPVNSTIKNNYAGISFSPQLNLLNSFSDFSIAFGSQLDLGYRLTSNDNNSNLFASIPAMLLVNAGHLASRDFFSAFGIFGGGGYDFCFLNGTTEQGIIVSGGLRFWLFKKSFTLRYSQLILDENKINMRIISLQFNLGKYIKQVYRNNKISNFEKPLRR